MAEVTRTLDVNWLLYLYAFCGPSQIRTKYAYIVRELREKHEHLGQLYAR